MPEQRGEPPDDREPETHPTPAGMVARARRELDEFVEHARAIGGADTDTGVDDVDTHCVSTPPRAEHDAAGARIANGVRDEIAHDALEQDRIGVDGEPRPHRAQNQSIGDCLRSQIGGDAREQRLERERSRRRMQRPSLQLRKVEKLPKQSFERLD